MRTPFVLTIVIIGLILLASETAVHCQQNQAPQVGKELLPYYSQQGPMGQFFRTFKGDRRLQNVAVVGRRAGFLAAYSEAGQAWTFFEDDLDVNVKKIGEGAKGKIRIELGEPRLQLQKSKALYGLLVIDVPSNAIPIHWLTREAVELYRQRLVPDGILVFHLSHVNDFVDLEPVLGNVAADLQYVAYTSRFTPSAKEKKVGIMASLWLAMARKKEDLAPLLKTDPLQSARTRADWKVWTDDNSDIFGAIRKRPDK